MHSSRKKHILSQLLSLIITDGSHIYHVSASTPTTNQGQSRKITHSSNHENLNYTLTNTFANMIFITIDTDKINHINEDIICS